MHLETSTILAIWAVAGPRLDGIFLGQIQDILFGGIELIANLPGFGVSCLFLGKLFGVFFQVLGATRDSRKRMKKDEKVLYIK